ncbi:MAG: hypothetical protein R3F27_12555 [Gammaproteobacteria bacterium]
MQDKTTDSKAVEHSVRARLREEMREYAIIFVYLYICFTVLLLYKAAILDAAGMRFVPFGIAAVKALILGKFLLIGKAVGVGDRGEAGTLLQLIVRKSVMLLLLLVVLSIVEELVTGWFHGHSFAQTMAEFGSRLPEMAVSSLLMLMVLLPFVAVKELSGALGPGVLQRTLRGPPDRS